MPLMTNLSLSYLSLFMLHSRGEIPREELGDVSPPPPTNVQRQLICSPQ